MHPSIVLLVHQPMFATDIVAQRTTQLRARTHREHVQIRSQYCSIWAFCAVRGPRFHSRTNIKTCAALLFHDVALIGPCAPSDPPTFVAGLGGGSRPPPLFVVRSQQVFHFIALLSNSQLRGDKNRWWLRECGTPPRVGSLGRRSDAQRLSKCIFPWFIYL